MGVIFKSPKLPEPAPIQMPSTDDVPNLEDEAIARAEEEAQRKRDRNRKGRRSTILTGTGLSEIEDENIDQKTLLGS
jgi:hypothetical protein